MNGGAYTSPTLYMITRVTTLLSGSVIFPYAAEDSGPDTGLIGAAPKQPVNIVTSNMMPVVDNNRVMSSPFFDLTITCISTSCQISGTPAERFNACVALTG